MVPMVDTCVCDSELIQVATERSVTTEVAIGEEFSIQLFEILDPASNEVSNCTLSEVSVSVNELSQDAFSARADESTSGSILVSPTNQAVFQLAAIEPI